MKLTGVSYGEHFEQALAVTSEEEAAEMFELLVAYQMGAIVANSTGRVNAADVRKQAIEHVKTNLGYMAGYYDKPTREKIQRLYGAVHPIFGKA